MMHEKNNYCLQILYASETVFFCIQQFNIGVLDENPSTIAGVVNILDHLHQYVPTDGRQVYTILTWGDGLSCESHTDAQNSRANAETPLARLEGLEPAAQEFHKRMILMQVYMCGCTIIYRLNLHIDVIQF